MQRGARRRTQPKKPENLLARDTGLYPARDVILIRFSAPAQPGQLRGGLVVILSALSKMPIMSNWRVNVLPLLSRLPVISFWPQPKSGLCRVFPLALYWNVAGCSQVTGWWIQPAALPHRCVLTAHLSVMMPQLALFTHLGQAAIYGKL